jgi:hypothetical protein
MIQRNIFTAEAGSQSALKFLDEALRSPDFPRKLRPRGEKIMRGVRSLNKEIGILVLGVRSKMAASKTSLLSSNPVTSLSWAAQGLENAASDLKLLSHRDPETLVPLHKLSETLREDVQSLAEEIGEYQRSFHQLDWAGETFDELMEGLRGSPGRVAYRWASRNAEKTR